MNMQQHNDGGPAFPHLRKHVGPNTYEPIAEGGMSLRDCNKHGSVQTAAKQLGEMLKV